jgi:hypothetical protein
VSTMCLRNGSNFNHINKTESPGSSVSIVTRLRAGRSRFDSGRGIELSLRYRILTGSGVHPAPYPTDTVGFFPGGKAGGA